MSDLLRDGLTWLESMRSTHLASPIAYRHGEQTVNLSATVGKTEYQTQDESGATVGAQVRDFLISAADLPFDPQVGDVIIFEGQTFEVMNLPGQGCVRPSDPYGNTFRVHTRKVST